LLLTNRRFFRALFQKQLSSVRDGLRETLAAADEVQQALSKVRLAIKLECQTQELTKKEIECPKDKLGKVIGKGGAMVAKIQEVCKVVIDVENETRTIAITGSDNSIQAAVNEIEKILRMEEQELELESNLVRYLSAKHVTVIEQLRTEFPTSFLDVARPSGKLQIRGSPEDVAGIKSKVFGMQVISKSRQLQGGKEAAILLGKKGATIDKLCADHGVSIEVEKDDEEHATAFIVGLSSNVESALREIDDLMNDNKDATEEIKISTILKHILLADVGRKIKEVQSMVSAGLADGINCFVTVSKEPGAKDYPEVLVKTRQMAMSQAVELTRIQLNALDHLSSSLSVDPTIVPRFIGKGGGTIKKLTEGKDVFIEVDKGSAEIRYGATTQEAVDALKIELQEMVENNSIARLPVDPAILKDQYKDLARSSLKKNLAGKVWLDVDEEKSSIVLLGRSDELETATALVQEFIANNHLGEVSVTDEDEEALLMGGKTCTIMKFSEDLNVKLNIDRENHVCYARGSKVNVEMAVNRLRQYLHGGNGHSVAKLSVTEQVVGSVIGKNGKTRQELEKKHVGVTIFISRSHVVTIRGPENSVSSCKIEIAKMVASARVKQAIEVSESLKGILQKKDFAKRISQQIPVHITVEGDQVIVKGSFYDVRDAVSLINEMITGEYKTMVELDASLFSKVRNTCRDSSHLERMENVSGGKIELYFSTGSIAISGKRCNVKKAKDQVYGFLEFIQPGVFERVKISKPLYSSVGQAPVLAEVSAAAGGVTVYLDRDLGQIIMMSNDKVKLQQAIQSLVAKITDAERLACVVEFSAEDSWILPVIIGKNGQNVTSLRSKFPSCKIDVSKEYRTITLVGDTEEAVNGVREAVNLAVEKARNENVFVRIPEEYIPQFVGKGGVNVKALSANHGAEIQRLTKGPSNFKITGEALKVEATKMAIDEWLSRKTEANAVLSFHVEKPKDLPFILGEKGEFVRSMQEKFKCRIDIDKKALIVNVKGDTSDIREAVVEMLKDKITEERRKLASKQSSKENNLNSAQTSMNPVFSKQLASDKDSNERNLQSGTDSEESVSSNEFPSKPVGVANSTIDSKGRKKKQFDVSINEGTKEGKSLCAMLLAED
jgi:polyribonucleotide nucleotidyltransferase